MIELVDSTVEHAQFLANHLRQEEILEVTAASRLSIYDTIMSSINRSVEVQTVLWDGDVIAIVGLQPHSVLSDKASPWLLTTEEVKRHPRELLRLSRQFLERWIQQYSLLENYIDSRYEPSLRWARKVGFTVEEPQPYGPYGEFFNRIEIRRD
jgi:hypothetical protein|tara:strand:- start:1763 stop:2221 length:459 start_codon:yes stop_codon:yes gene_type:complete